MDLQFFKISINLLSDILNSVDHSNVLASLFSKSLFSQFIFFEIYYTILLLIYIYLFLNVYVLRFSMASSLYIYNCVYKCE